MEALKPLPGEVGTMYAMFADYCLAGHARRLASTAARYGRHIRWTERLSSKFHWVQRAQQYDYQMALARAERLAAQGAQE